ncbi:MAG: hypothetical protein EOO27_43745, partial [Comamonadaceae bacterium]
MYISTAGSGASNLTVSNNVISSYLSVSQSTLGDTSVTGNVVSADRNGRNTFYSNARGRLYGLRVDAGSNPATPAPTVTSNAVNGADFAFNFRGANLKPAQITNNTGTGNTANVAAYGGILTGNLSLGPNDPGPKFVVDSADCFESPFGGLTVGSGTTMTVAPGTALKVLNGLTGSGIGFGGCDFGTKSTLTVNGTLVASGTQADPVVLTTIKDDTVGGDTGGDGNATSPGTLDWGGITISNGRGVMSWARLAGTTAPLAVSSGTLAIRGKWLGPKIMACGWSAGTCFVDASRVDWGTTAGPFEDPESPLACGAVLVFQWVGASAGDSNAYQTGSCSAQA